MRLRLATCADVLYVRAKPAPNSMPTNATYGNRRFVLLVLFALPGFTAGFVWGREYSYERRKADTIKAIEQKLAEPEKDRVPM